MMCAAVSEGQTTPTLCECTVYTFLMKLNLLFWLLAMWDQMHVNKQLLSMCYAIVRNQMLLFDDLCIQSIFQAFLYNRKKKKCSHSFITSMTDTL